MLVEFGYFLSNFKVTGEVAAIEVEASIDDPRVYEFNIRSERYPTTGELISYSGFPILSMSGHQGFLKKITRNCSLTAWKSWLRATTPGPQRHTRTSCSNRIWRRRIQTLTSAQVLEKFMTRAYRRPPTDREIARMIRLYGRLHSRNGSFEDSILGALNAVLCAPGFLLLDSQADGESHDPDFQPARMIIELASRLSYFLWSTMPDDRLFELAERGVLHRPDVLRKETLRMIDDPRSDEFVEHFCSQWLNLDSVYSVAVNPEYFPWFSRDAQR